MGKWKGVPPPIVPSTAVLDIRWLKLPNHDAEAEVRALPERFREKAFALLRRLSTLSKSQFRIKPTYVDHLFEAKLAASDGNLRLLFVYGKNAIIWCIGGFVKNDDSHGNRRLASYAALALAAKNYTLTNEEE
ncbi:MAG TPA: hypothetical protein VGC72_17775 [Candidatus Elarobacter sp.]